MRCNYLKGKLKLLRLLRKPRQMHLSKALSSTVAFDAENNDDEPSEEDEEELALLTKRVQRLLKRRKTFLCH